MKIAISWISLAACMVIIFCFSAQTADESSNTSGGFSEFLAKILHQNFEILPAYRQEEILNSCQFIVRKFAHFSIYGFLGMLSFFACKVSNFRYFKIIAAIISLVYAISDEIHQHYVPGRSCELRDVFIDFSGAVTGIIALTILFKIINIYKEKKNDRNKCIKNI